MSLRPITTAHIRIEGYGITLVVLKDREEMSQYITNQNWIIGDSISYNYSPSQKMHEFKLGQPDGETEFFVPEEKLGCLHLERRSPVVITPVAPEEK